MKKLIAAFIALGFVSMAANQAIADSVVVGISFGANPGPTNWTSESNLTGATSNDLIAEDGTSSDINFTYSIPVGASTFDVTPDATTIPIHTPSLVNLDQNINFGGAAAVFNGTLSNLMKDSTYDLWVIVARQNNSIDQNVAITGATTTTFNQIDPDRELIVNSSVGSSSDDFDLYALPIESSDAGTIGIDIKALSTGGYAISGLAISPEPISAVPSPSSASLCLLSLGMVGIMRWRRLSPIGSSRR